MTKIIATAAIALSLLTGVVATAAFAFPPTTADGM